MLVCIQAQARNAYQRTAPLVGYVTGSCNMVAEVFDEDIEKTALWFKTRNPLLGDVSPRDMIRLRRFDRLRRFVLRAIADMAAARKQPVHGEPAG